MNNEARVALYYAPAPEDPLWQAGCRWLGRDPDTAAPLPQPDLPDIAAVTADARSYGFHATLKAPFRFRAPWFTVLADIERLAGQIAPFDLPTLRVAELSGFLALRETEPCPPLQSLADWCIAELDHHRIPPTEAELARRRGNGLSPERDAMLLRWGYPSAFKTWRFHMTLTRKLSDAERPTWQAAAEAYFAAALAVPRRVDAISVFTQAGPGQPFTIAERVPLRG